MHGDLVFEESVLAKVLQNKDSCMAVSSTLPLPEKDFKAVIVDGKIEKVGIEFFDNALSAQPLYKLQKRDWLVWLDEIVRFCENGNRKCYAENAYNQISSQCAVYPLDVRNALCSEVDNLDDLAVVSARVKAL
jgi:phosphoenolpyruvate phosphomutase